MSFPKAGLPGERLKRFPISIPEVSVFLNSDLSIAFFPGIFFFCGSLQGLVLLYPHVFANWIAFLFD